MKFEELKGLIRETIAEVDGEKGPGHFFWKRLHKDRNKPAWAGRTIPGDELPQATPGLLDKIKVGTTIVKAAHLGSGPQNWEVLNVSGESPDRVWTLAAFNADDDGQFLDYITADGKRLEDEATEEEMSDELALHQMATLKPHSSFNS